jgi:hypothetical protein
MEINGDVEVKKINSGVSVPQALFDILGEYRSEREACNRIRLLNWILTFIIIVIITASYYHVRSTGGFYNTINRYKLYYESFVSKFTSRAN